jgi:hypothetical protein
MKQPSPIEMIEAHQKRLDDARTKPLEGINALGLLQMVYRGEVQVSPQQMRAAIESLPFETPKLASTTSIHFEGSFAQLLDRAIERSQRPIKLIEAQAVPSHPPEELNKGPMPRLRRRV